jgi:hypothetical protein
VGGDCGGDNDDDIAIGVTTDAAGDDNYAGVEPLRSD